MTQKSSSNIKKLVGVGFNRRNPHIQSMMANKSFPYHDEYEDFNYSDEELELADKIKDKYKSPDDGINPFDLRDRGAPSNISKVTEIAKGLSPFPAMYKKRDGHIGKSAENISNIHSSGFYMGSKISGHTYDRENIEYLEDDFDLPVYSLEDLAIKQLKEYIHIVLTEVL